MTKRKGKWTSSQESAGIIISRLIHEGPLYTPDLDEQSKGIDVNSFGPLKKEENKKSARIKHSTLRKLLEQFEEDMKIIRLDSGKKTPAGQEICRYDLTIMGLMEWFDRFDSSNKSTKEIRKTIIESKKWIPWICSMWTTLADFYHEKKMFAILLDTRNLIKIAYNTYPKQTMTIKAIIVIDDVQFDAVEIVYNFKNLLKMYELLFTFTFVFYLMTVNFTLNKKKWIWKKQDWLRETLEIIKHDVELSSFCDKHIPEMLKKSQYAKGKLEEIYGKI